METYKKTIDGIVVYKEKNEIVIYNEDKQWLNPSHEMLLDNG